MKASILILLIFIGIVSSCDNQDTGKKELNVYFDLDSLLNEQVRLLSLENAELNKTVIMDGQVENRVDHPDSIAWELEFIIIRDFDLNKSHFIGSYKIEESTSKVRYELDDQIDAPVQFFELAKDAGQVKTISSNYFEDKTIYQHRRNLNMIFENGLLKAYEIKGFQKMLLKDTIHYSIAGVIN